MEKRRVMEKNDEMIAKGISYLIRNAKRVQVAERKAGRRYYPWNLSRR